MKAIVNKMRKCIVLVPLLLLLYVPVEVRAAKQKRFGIELCKRHCARYNRCYGIRYNITSITCTILKDRNTDGEDVHVSRKDILQRFQAPAICSPSQFYSRLCIVNNKGHIVHIAETTTSFEEEIQKAAALNMSSLQNLVCAMEQFMKTTCNIPDGHYSKTDVFGGIIQKEFLPGRRYMNQITFLVGSDNVVPDVKILTLSVTDASSFDLRPMTWNMTYLLNKNSSGMAHYYGRRGDVAKAKFQYLFGQVIFLFDRASSGNFLHDMDLSGNVRGSIELPNRSEAMFIVVHLYLPLNATFIPPMAYLLQHATFEKGLKKWYTEHYNGSFI